MTNLLIGLDRARKTPLAIQIYLAVREAIESGKLRPDAKLPSWRDLAVQLGVSRGTVRQAYERLIDEQFAVGMGAAGTRVSKRPQSPPPVPQKPVETPLLNLFHDFGNPPLAFQMGVPAQDGFPYKLWSRIVTREARRSSSAPVGYPDPRGDPELRREIAAYLAIARGIQCSPAQIFITSGFSGALGLAVHALGITGQTAWCEDPGFPLTRTALALAGVNNAPVPVDTEGMSVTAGLQIAPDAALAVVTPGQQAPLGMTMSLSRRSELLDWARRHDTWIIEDDYLSELQLGGRAAPALASLDPSGRVLHIGSFSKTISPALRLGFMVVPPQLAERFGVITACLAPAPTTTMQYAVATFMREGHYLRHLRRMKKLYSSRREKLIRILQEEAADVLEIQATAGIAIVVRFLNEAEDTDITLRGLPYGLAPSPLSLWYADTIKPHGLLLGVTNCGDEHQMVMHCRRLAELLRHS
ncbi:PLP-dependent aminotransferase family protein [Enterobacter kobei]|uniref:MocR-like pyridoxine biosynthesis transcription factor PdxR n=1 Tax=Enterobacter kobei TaxID=208224 RepID=UPI002006B550|nr:PLP-dependent aminotransferase family protein [Enterobacter kobei]MCK7113865.1 PLP-dependent aminotransferase family protein [Enterobacter kobei]